MLDYHAPQRLWNETIPVELIPSPCCGETGMTKVGAAPDGSHILMECRCGTVSKVSG